MDLQDSNDIRRIVLKPCNPDRHGRFIRTLSRENFAALYAADGLWDESRNDQEPRHPERYAMVQVGGELVGFIAQRADHDYLYLQTIQLLLNSTRTGSGECAAGAYRNPGTAERLPWYSPPCPPSESRLYLVSPPYVSASGQHKRANRAPGKSAVAQRGWHAETRCWTINRARLA